MGSVINTMLIREFVFPDSRFTLIADIKLSLMTNTLMFVIGMVILWVLIELWETNVYAAKLLTNGITFFANFGIRAVFFRK